MASDSYTNNSSIATDSSNLTKNLITINAAAQLLLKLTSLNYFSWKAQFNTLLFGLNLLGCLDGNFPCLSATVIANELTVLGDPPSDVNLLVYTTRGLGPVYKELITALRTQDTVVPFEKLFDKIIDHETFLFYNEKQYPDPTPPITNLAQTSSSSHRPPKSLSPSSAPSLLPNPVFVNWTFVAEDMLEKLKYMQIDTISCCNENELHCSEKHSVLFATLFGF
ncbi:Uncharacterized protein TCM_025775 [Theobroma cacao]|uniref:Retrotransposon Copia-like N-terminal domain-containing protein n=1 Tax=Theobroma cacao TaxID=3641 RepID=A0A061EZ84_THECC|nr:Uncharacterized protein TCM_025775 [Theobroma cacao]